MYGEQVNIFDIPHSLPSSSHMAAVASRTPSGPIKVDSNRYMPDYGGILEVPGTKTKQSGIKIGIPFDTNPYYVRIVSDTEVPKTSEPRGPDCLLITSHLETLNNNDLDQNGSGFSTIRAVGKALYLDLVKPIPCGSTAPDIHYFTTYCHVPYSYKITGLKYHDNSSDFLIVKFLQGIKLMKLNSSYRIPPKFHVSQDNCETDSDQTEVNDCDTNPLPDQSALDSFDSFAEKQGVLVKDASMSRSQNWLYMASSDCQNLYVKLYDLSTSKQCYNILTTDRDDDVKIRREESRRCSTDRKKSLRSFIPSKPSFEELQQIVCDPDHLINSLMVTSNRVSLVDPREKSIAMSYADKFKILSASPTERFKQVEFSHFNTQQFYLMSDERIRAMDKRYPSKDLNILDHMIDSSTYDMMTMKLAASEKAKQETLCLSAYGRLVNPRSMHNPIHEPSPTVISGKAADELYGLAVSSGSIFESDDVLFSTLQLSQEGEVCVRGFLTPRDSFLDFGDNSTAMPMIKAIKKSCSTNEKPSNPDLEDSDDSESRVQDPADDENQINILDPSYVLEAEKLLTTKRAKLKYDWMKKKMRRK